ncbi:sulfatase-like hydrolase/transferase [Flavimaricola marinus]|uniref:Sulfatase n=1 Tax=Flavimaricola marinus TaxID=1819565 RepID=A0A238LI85_9RHOB|nr:sulfatase-like hydrolase/transferase [Flavimaricola marinus]SMY09253.1 Sulfatase [Flavimaricola marinus]
MPRNLILITYDSCRFDSAQAAKAPNLARLGELEQRYSYASWTAPSHYTFMMGLVPHLSPPNVYASEVYKEDFRKWGDRLDIPDLSFGTFLPQLSLPGMLKQYGYRTNARVSMPVLNPHTVINNAFDDYQLMSNHNDFKGMVDGITFSRDQPSFHFFNLGETHYPYMLDDASLPHISGLHGVAKTLSKGGDAGGHIQKSEEMDIEDFFQDEVMRGLHQQQIRCVEYLDEILGGLYDKAPSDTWFMIMGDHGEAFGEGGYFGHGPVMHEKVFQVPFVEGLRPRKARLI